jgi:beta-glucosidase
VSAAAAADLAVVVVGLPASMETEGRDRAHIDIPAAHNDLVTAVLRAQANTVVVLINGSAVALPWADRVPALLEAWLGGQAAGGAIADVLTGAVNPSGRLSETFPVRIEDTPGFLNFPTAGDGTVRFAEGIFTGHRWYDARKIAPRFPFGYGLSYTTFDLDGLDIDDRDFAATGSVEVCATVHNTGRRAGKHVVQLYVSECAPTVPRPHRELRAFTKVALGAGASRTIRFTLDWRDFAWWDTRSGAWVMESGEYEIAIGESSARFPLTARIHLESTHAAPTVIDRATPLAVALRHPIASQHLQPMIDAMKERFGVGPGFDMMMLFMSDTPLRKFPMMGSMTEGQLSGLIAACAQPAP